MKHMDDTGHKLTRLNATIARNAKYIEYVQAVKRSQQLTRTIWLCHVIDHLAGLLDGEGEEHPELLSREARRLHRYIFLCIRSTGCDIALTTLTTYLTRKYDELHKYPDKDVDATNIEYRQRFLTEYLQNLERKQCARIAELNKLLGDHHD